MKVLVTAIVLFAIAVTPLHAQVDERARKQQLVTELMKALDVKQLTQSMIETVMGRMSEGRPASVDASSDSASTRQADAALKKEREHLEAFRLRLYARIDYVKFANEVYVPLFTKTFSGDELEQLVAFCRTKAGQKFIGLMPNLSMNVIMDGMRLFQPDMTAVEDELQNEELAREPEKKALHDILAMATAAEAYATDTNKYPDVHSLDDLEKVLSPTYIKTLPKLDPWGQPYVWLTSADHAHYRIVCGGSDKHVDGSSEVISVIDPKNAIRTSDSTQDFIYQDGNVVQGPASVVAPESHD
jgi:hypothetical protein